jgi:hypothetical protein
MENTTALTISTEAFALARTSKSGKVTERGLLGLITSGNKDERTFTASALSLACWQTGQFKPILKELGRLFGGKAWDFSLKMISLDVNAPKKAAMLQLIKGIVESFPDAKAEKAIYINLCKSILNYEESMEDARREREAARIAAEAGAQ